MKPILTGVTAAILGALGVGLAAAAPMLESLLPSPWGLLPGVAGFVLAALAGAARPALKATDGRPVLQGAALGVATALGGVLVQLWPSVPADYHGPALGAAAVLTWLTGRQLPMLGAAPAATPAATPAAPAGTEGGAP